MKCSCAPFGTLLQGVSRHAILENRLGSDAVGDWHRNERLFLYLSAQCTGKEEEEEEVAQSTISHGMAMTNQWCRSYGRKSGVHFGSRHLLLTLCVGTRCG
jgi:hypothetical protein